jgi:hypothetical protein
MSSLVINNAIGWAQFRLRGGLKGHAVLALAYGGLVAIVVVLMASIARSPGERARMLDGCRIMLLMAQIIMMITLGSVAVSSAIRRDLVGRQIESHRLMPVAPLHAVLGYVVGAPSRILMLCGLNFIAGLVICLMIQSLPQDWIFFNLLLLSFSVMMWSMMALTGFISRGIFWVIGGLIFFMVVTDGGLYTLVPGLLVLVGAIHKGITEGQFPSAMLLDTTIGISVAAQLMVALLCILGAARKYDRGDLFGLPLWFSLSTLLIWIAISTYGIDHMDQLDWPMRRFNQNDPNVPWIGTIVASLLLAVLVMSSLASADIARVQRRRARGESARAFSWALLPCIPLCGALIASITATVPALVSRNWNFFAPTPMYVTPPLAPGQHPGASKPIRPSPPTRQMIAAAPLVVNRIIPVGLHDVANVVAAASVIFLAQMYLLMRLIYPISRRPALAMLAMIAVFWFVPMSADLIYYSIRFPNHETNIDHFGQVSALGAIIGVYQSPPTRHLVGIIAQVGILIGLFLLYKMVEHRRRIRSEAALR